MWQLFFIVCFKSCLKDKALVKLFCPIDWNMLWQSTGQEVNGSCVAISLMRNLARTLIWTVDCLCIKHNDKSESSLKSHPTLIDLYIRWLCQKIILKAHLYSLSGTSLIRALDILLKSDRCLSLFIFLVLFSLCSSDWIISILLCQAH